MSACAFAYRCILRVDVQRSGEHRIELWRVGLRNSRGGGEEAKTGSCEGTRGRSWGARGKRELLSQYDSPLPRSLVVRLKRTLKSHSSPLPSCSALWLFRFIVRNTICIAITMPSPAYTKLLLPFHYLSSRFPLTEAGGRVLGHCWLYQSVRSLYVSTRFQLISWISVESSNPQWRIFRKNGGG